MLSGRATVPSLLFLAFFSILGSPWSQASGGTVLPTPPGLHPGDEYYLAFVTSQSTTATSPDAATYDSFVNALANTAGIGTIAGINWHACVNTWNNPIADSVLVMPGFPVYDVIGDFLASSPNYMVRSGPAIPIDISEQGVQVIVPGGPVVGQSGPG